MSTLKVTILGCGNSTGVPSIGGFWGVCDPNEPKNKRFCCSLAVQSGDTSLVIDTGLDLRHQSALFDITNINGILFSHHHSDHIDGIYTLRSLSMRNNHKTFPCYGSAETIHQLKRRFDYMFDAGDLSQLYPPVLTAHTYNDDDYMSLQHINDIAYVPFLMDHGTCHTLGYRFGDLSYCADMWRLDNNALKTISGSKILIVDGAGYHDPENPAHADLETIYSYNEIIGAEQVYITGLSPRMDYKTLQDELPEGYYPAYDGMCFEIFQM